MDSWKPSKKDQKQYRHFDSPLSLEELGRVANDRNAVAKNAFFPFIKYEESYSSFRPIGKRKKSREIRYASRRDAAIFSRYRFELSKRYEQILLNLNLTESVLAYRRIPVKDGSRAGKCNIHHAKDAFDIIKKFEKCSVVALDISKFFENLDHHRIKAVWCRLLGTSVLPDDHYAVYQAITNYSVVDRKRAYTVLGFFGTKPSGAQGYLVSKGDIPKQLCSPEDFRNKICGKAIGFKNIIEKNKRDHGVPQGAPLSDIIANAYLLDFDVYMMKLASLLGDYYMRYSDDILFIVPIDAPKAIALMRKVQIHIKLQGKNLHIKEEKCTIDQFVWVGGDLEYSSIYPLGKSRNGLNYLGFRFDGKKIYLRDSTVSNFRRKIAKTINGKVRKLINRYPGKDAYFLKPLLKTDKIIEKFGRVRCFDNHTDKKSWTFWTYVKRANKVFGRDAAICKQIRRYRDDIRCLADNKLKKNFKK